MATIKKDDVLLLLNEAVKIAAAVVPGLTFVGVGIDLLSRAGNAAKAIKDNAAVSTKINTDVQEILDKYSEKEDILKAFAKTADGAKKKGKLLLSKKKAPKNCLYANFIKYVKNSIDNDISKFINDLCKYDLTTDMQTTIKNIFKELVQIVNDALAGTLSIETKTAVKSINQHTDDKIDTSTEVIIREIKKIAPATATQSDEPKPPITLPQTQPYSPKASDIIKPASAPADARYDTTGIKYYTFGSYPHEWNGEDKPILWRKLGRTASDDTVLLMSEYILDCAQYHHDEEDEEISWETSDIRQWLNGTGQGSYYDGERQESFFEMAFKKPEEKELIQKAANGDKVFLLSVEEAIKQLFFKSDSEINGNTVNINRATHGTEYARIEKDDGCELYVFTVDDNKTNYKGQFKDYADNSWWWLKDITLSGGFSFAARVHSDGAVDGHDNEIFDINVLGINEGVRPCVRVRL
ncbi:MAG: DUF6273 domain-containing protein [Clostridiales bacterium]|nr:DUF6273 domain-containing protein [Clostridiales bacterium]